MLLRQKLQNFHQRVALGFRRASNTVCSQQYDNTTTITLRPYNLREEESLKNENHQEQLRWILDCTSVLKSEAPLS